MFRQAFLYADRSFLTCETEFVPNLAVLENSV